MKKLSIVIGVVLSLAVCFCDAVAGQKKDAGELQGIWVPESTVSKLRKTMSPISSGPEMIIISRTADRRWKLSWTNFHEGSWRYILGYTKDARDEKKGFLRVSAWENPSPDNSGSGEVRLNIGSDKSGTVLTITFAGASFINHQGERFVKIPLELDRYANGLLLEGKWHDESNRAFIFSPGGEAKWPDGSFQYEVSMDPGEAGCDYISMRAEGEPGGYRRYGFKRTRDSLSLYKIIYDQPAPISCEDKPFAVLKRGE